MFGIFQVLFIGLFYNLGEIFIKSGEGMINFGNEIISLGDE